MVVTRLGHPWEGFQMNFDFEYTTPQIKTCCPEKQWHMYATTSLQIRARANKRAADRFHEVKWDMAVLPLS